MAQAQNTVTVRVFDGTNGRTVGSGETVSAVVLSGNSEVARWSLLTDTEGTAQVAVPAGGNISLFLSVTFDGVEYSERFEVFGDDVLDLTVYEIARNVGADVTERVALIVNRAAEPDRLDVQHLVRFENSGSRAAIFGQGELLIPVPETMFNLQVESDLSLDTPFGLIDAGGRSLGAELLGMRPRHVVLETFVAPGSGTVALGYLVAAPDNETTLSYHLARPVAEFQVLVPADDDLEAGSGETQLVNIDGIEYRQQDLGSRLAGSVVSVEISGLHGEADSGFLSGTTTLLIALAAVVIPTSAAIGYALFYRPSGRRRA